jgi:DNA-binding MarR family transcriptional regulator
VLGERDRIDGLLAQWGRERPDLDTTPLEVIARVARVSDHLDRLVDATLGRYGIKWWELDVLGALRRSGEPFRLSPGELSDRLMVSTGTMTARVDRLVEKGLVAREPATHDRRSVIVSLTPEGQELIDEVMVVHLANLERILAPLERPDQREIANALRQLLIALEGAATQER